MNSFNFAVFVLSQIIKIRRKDSKTLGRIFKAVLICFEIFNIVWLITGSVWLYTDGTCHDRFYSLWAMTLAILVISYIFIGIIAGACCCFCILGSFGVIAKGKN